MKRIFITCVVMASLMACNSNSGGSNDKPAETTDEKKSAETPITDNPDYAAGLDLIAKSDCLTCHRVDEKLTGPSYRDVANKYAPDGASAVPKLAEKIMKGGSGVWGPVPMTGHPTISEVDAEAMVKYILLLKNK